MRGIAFAFTALMIKALGLRSCSEMALIVRSVVGERKLRLLWFALYDDATVRQWRWLYGRYDKIEVTVTKEPY